MTLRVQPDRSSAESQVCSFQLLAARRNHRRPEGKPVERRRIALKRAQPAMLTTGRPLCERNSAPNTSPGSLSRYCRPLASVGLGLPTELRQSLA